MLERQEDRAKEITGVDGSDLMWYNRQAGRPGQRCCRVVAIFSLDNSATQHSALTLLKRIPKTINHPSKHLKTAEITQNFM